MPLLLGVPNVSEGTDPAKIDALTQGFTRRHAALLDRHSDTTHNRTVLTVADDAGQLRRALREGARACLDELDMREHRGAHPCIGALDVCPVVWLRGEQRDEARAEALAVAELIAGLDIPVFLYGELARNEVRSERAHFRTGGFRRLGERMAAGELVPDLGPARPHPTAGATLVTARAPLAAFNLELAGADLPVAAAIASQLRESGGGLPGVRALAIGFGEGGMQISTNVHDPIAVPLGEVVGRVEELARPSGAQVVAAEIVGLVPQAAIEGFPEHVPWVSGSDPEETVIEAIPALAGH